MKLLDLKLINFRKLSSLPQPTMIFNSDINILVGANNAGKTSILKAIQKLFENEEFDAKKDLNYLVKDGNLTIEATIKITMEQWKSYLRVALGQHTQISFNAVNIDTMAESLFDLPIKLKHNVSFVNEKESNYQISGDLYNEDLNKVATDNDKRTLITTAIQLFINADFYNVYKTPLYLDSKGEIKEQEKFKPLNQIENTKNSKDIEIRGLLYALKKKDPEQFVLFKKRLLEIFTELNDIDVIHNEDSGYFELQLHEKLKKNGDTQNVKYDIKNVGEGMQTLVKMFSSILLHKPSIVLMDEPEVHMHPSLIKEFVRYIKVLSAEIQFIITTHSIVLMNEIGEDKIFTLRNELSQKGIIVKKATEKQDVLNSFSDLGFELSAFNYGQNPNFYVFVEGESDESYIKVFAEKLSKAKELNNKHVEFVSLKGKGDRYKLSLLIQKLETEFADKPVLVVLDEDETTAGEKQQLEAKFKSPNKLYYLSKRQIESYLINDRIIQTTLLNNCKSEGEKKKVIGTNFNNVLYDLANEQKEDVFHRILRDFYINGTLLREFEMRDAINQLRNTEKVDLSGKILAKLVSATTEKFYTLSKNSVISIEEFEKNWNNNNYRLSRCDARVLLSSLNKWMMKNEIKTPLQLRPISEIANHFTQETIHQDIAKLIDHILAL